MEKSSLDKVKYTEFFGVDSPEITDELTTRWEILSRNADLPCIGETGEMFKYDSLQAM
jgi:hypothetical protein